LPQIIETLLEARYALSEPACNVIFPSSCRRFCENLSVLSNSIILPAGRNRWEFSNPGRLLHVVGYDYDGIPFLELKDQFLDLARGNGIECRAEARPSARLPVNRQGTCDAQALLLSAGEAAPDVLWDLVFNLVPKGPLHRAMLYDFIQLTAIPEPFNFNRSHVVINRHGGEWIGLLNTISDPAPNLVGEVPL